MIAQDGLTGHVRASRWQPLPTSVPGTKYKKLSTEEVAKKTEENCKTNTKTLLTLHYVCLIHTSNT